MSIIVFGHLWEKEGIICNKSIFAKGSPKIRIIPYHSVSISDAHDGKVP